MILQIRTFSKKRITDKIDKMNVEEFKIVQEKTMNMIVPT